MNLVYSASIADCLSKPDAPDVDFDVRRDRDVTIVAVILMVLAPSDSPRSRP